MNQQLTLEDFKLMYGTLHRLPLGVSSREVHDKLANLIKELERPDHPEYQSIVVYTPNEM